MRVLGLAKGTLVAQWHQILDQRRGRSVWQSNVPEARRGGSQGRARACPPGAARPYTESVSLDFHSDLSEETSQVSPSQRQDPSTTATRICSAGDVVAPLPPLTSTLHAATSNPLPHHSVGESCLPCDRPPTRVCHTVDSVVLSRTSGYAPSTLARPRRLFPPLKTPSPLVALHCAHRSPSSARLLPLIVHGPARPHSARHTQSRQTTCYGTQFRRSVAGI